MVSHTDRSQQTCFVHLWCTDDLRELLVEKGATEAVTTVKLENAGNEVRFESPDTVRSLHSMVSSQDMVLVAEEVLNVLAGQVD